VLSIAKHSQIGAWVAMITWRRSSAGFCVASHLAYSGACFLDRRQKKH
jgi:hypothetical protein